MAVTDEDGQLGEKSNQTKVSLTNSLTDVNEDLINEKNNEIGRVTKWATGFEKLLEDPLGLKIFTVSSLILSIMCNAANYVSLILELFLF